MTRTMTVHPRWQRFLDELTDPPASLSETHARAVRQVWAELEAGVGARLPLPAVEADEQGAVVLAWSTDGYAAEVTVHPDRRLEWFVRDHRTGGFGGSETAQRGPLPSAFSRLFLGALGG